MLIAVIDFKSINASYLNQLCKNNADIGKLQLIQSCEGVNWEKCYEKFSKVKSVEIWEDDGVTDDFYSCFLKRCCHNVEKLSVSPYDESKETCTDVQSLNFLKHLKLCDFETCCATIHGVSNLQTLELSQPMKPIQLMELAEALKNKTFFTSLVLSGRFEGNLLDFIHKLPRLRHLTISPGLRVEGDLRLQKILSSRGGSLKFS